jgi:FixJ family two-component response regulator
MSEKPTIFVVDDDASVRKGLCRLLKSVAYETESCESADVFLGKGNLTRPGCVILDIRMPGMSGTELQDALLERKCLLPIIFITGHGDIPTSVHAMKKGAVTFLVKPFDDSVLLEAVDEALKRNRALRDQVDEARAACMRTGMLTPREHEVMGCVITGALNKQIAAHLGIAEKTVKIHRGRVMEKMGAVSVAELVRLCQAASVVPAEVRLQ